MTDCEPFSHFKHGFGFFNVQNYAIVIFIEDVLALLIIVERTFTVNFLYLMGILLKTCFKMWEIATIM